MYFLRISSTGEAPRVFPLPVGDDAIELVGGRGKDCDLDLPDLYVSRHQLCLRRENGEWSIARHPRSKNALVINGQPQAESALRPGDRVEVAGTLVEFLSDASSVDDRASHSGVRIVASPSLERDAVTLTPDEGRTALHAALGTVSRDKLIGIFAIGEAMAGIDDSKEQLERVLELVAEALGAQRGFVSFTDPREGIPDADIVYDPGGDGTQIAMSQSVLDKIQIERAAVLVKNTSDDLGPLVGKSVADVGIRSFVCAPMIVGDDVEGCLYLDRLGGTRGPFDEEDLAYLQTVARTAALALQSARYREGLVEENSKLRHVLGWKSSFVADCPAMQELLRRVARVAQSDASVLVLGETGTGKEHIARAIHEGSDRSSGPFEAFNCGACPENLIDAKLFGTRPGGFTEARHLRGKFELADGGTLFLDEIGEMPPAVQAKILRVTQDGLLEPIGSEEAIEVDVRVVCATHRDLVDQREELGFRDDLYYRLAEAVLRVPPLRDRGDDILTIAEQLLPEGYQLEDAAKLAVLTHPWSGGNVRELHQAMRHAVLEADGTRIRRKHLPREVVADGRRPLLDMQIASLAELEAKHIRKVLELTKFKKAPAARLLGISRETLYQKMKSYGIS